jgi:c(7)-type cytochrome triheme protein
VRGPGCVDCHEGAEKEARAGMPSKDFCMNCHEDLDKDPAKPLEKKVAYFLDGDGKPQWSAFGKQAEEIKFSHQAHAAKGVGCLDCHAGMDKDTGLTSGGPQRMSSCVACHEAKAAPEKRECRTCHTRTDRLTPPGNHAQLWTSLHGRMSREGAAVSTANNCALCHTNDACVTCHQTRPPMNHTEAWRGRPHGIAAGIDRSGCMVCHSSDACVRCHKETLPRSHGPTWGAPANRHCVSCHEPVRQSQGCAVCHQATPSHDASPPKPAWHTPQMNCRSCHALSMRHFDNGDNCNACHR